MSSYTAIEFFDRSFGPQMVPVTPIMGDISPSSKLNPKHMGKAPGVLTQSGWTSLDVNNLKFRCHDYATAKLWCEDWGANTGFAVGDGYVVIDNDEGREFSLILRGLLSKAPRRFVQDPKHERDAFFVRVLDFVGDGAQVANAELKFRNGVRVATVQILAKGKQSVIGGTHPGTRAPYVWDRDLDDIADIPAMTEDFFDLTIRKFITELGKLGWKLDGPAPRPTVSGVSAAPRPKTAPRNGSKPSASSASSASSRFAHARALLAMIPNRDIPPNITLSPADLWLEPYSGWIEAAYMLAAFFEADVLDPEAEEVFCEWSDQKAQIKQTSLDLWRSVKGQPLRYKSNALEKKVHELTVGEPDFPDDLNPDDPAMYVDPPKPRPVLESFIARWAFCAQKRGFVDMHDRIVITPQAFAQQHARFLAPLKRELRIKGKSSNIAGVLLTQTGPGLQLLFDITYAAGDPILIHGEETLPYCNFWRSTRMTPVPVTEADVKTWLDHLTFVLGSDAERDRFLRWCAFVINYPTKKPNWHYLVMSRQGLGKDSMMNPVKAALGKGSFREELSSSLTSNFDYAIETKLLILGETAHSHFTAKDFANKLKQIMSDPPPTLPINKKFLSVYHVQNRLAVILFSNDENPIPLELDQRRVHVVNRLHAAVGTPGYYQNLYAWFDNGGIELAASYLLGLTLTDAEQEEFKGNAPDSDDKAALEQLNVDPTRAALEALIRDARAGIKDGAPHTLIVRSQNLVDLIQQFDKGVRPPSTKTVSQLLSSMHRQGQGVRPYKIDAKEPHVCGVVTVAGESARLWVLADKTADGRAWSSLTDAEAFALWLGKPAPKSATVTPFPSKAKDEFPDDESVV
jgi:hypothetical protein